MEGLFAAMLVFAVAAVVQSLRRLRAPLELRSPDAPAADEAAPSPRARSATLAS